VKCSPAALLHNAQMNSGGYVTESGLPLFYKKNVFLWLVEFIENNNKLIQMVRW